MIGWATTNALPTMAPRGGTDRIVGINPLAIAISAGEELPIVYDAAFSGSSHGKIRVYRQQGKSLPEGWALNRDGQPTTDPAKAIDGLLMPIVGSRRGLIGRFARFTLAVRWRESNRSSWPENASAERARYTP